MVEYFGGARFALVTHFDGRKKLSWSCYRLAPSWGAKRGVFNIGRVERTTELVEKEEDNSEQRQTVGVSC